MPRVACRGCGAHRENPEMPCGVCGCILSRMVEALPIRTPADAFTAPGERFEYLR